MSHVLRTECVIVGDKAVGKTALVQMFTSDGTTFPKSYNMTFGVELYQKQVNIPDITSVVEMLLYDSSGHKLYTDCLKRYWHAPQMVLAVFDVTSEESLVAVPRWVSLAAGGLPGVLFGNKTDLVGRRAVSPGAGEAAAEKLGLEYFEGSAKEHDGTDEPFYFLAHTWHKRCRDET
ncbi:intraflagellar transport protein 27 homolog isoform X1 [Bacillus rossius redtenbacheri]|uniref:intraflagellar transport protein 27 homolog isoform X1 n=2 Tax=Bacillus rossius redtenbacheri TaxID=93214 RepID=UPI002FDD0CCA